MLVRNVTNRGNVPRRSANFLIPRFARRVAALQPSEATALTKHGTLSARTSLTSTQSQRRKGRLHDATELFPIRPFAMDHHRIRIHVHLRLARNEKSHSL